MNKIPVSKVIPVAFYALLLVIVGVIGYFGLSRRAQTSPAETSSLGESEATEPSGVIALADCQISAEKICAVSAGYDAEGNLLVNLKVHLSPLSELYGRLKDDARDVQFDCRIVDIAPRSVYCLGPYTLLPSSVTLEIYTVADDRLIASGIFGSGDMIPLPAPTAMPAEAAPTAAWVTPIAGLSPTPEIEFQITPSYPSYPSYPTYP